LGGEKLEHYLLLVSNMAVALPRTERVKLLTQVLEAFKTNPRWTDDQINLVLAEYGLEGAFEDNPNFFWHAVAGSLRMIGDEGLLELGELVAPQPQPELRSPAPVPGFWEPNLIRVFLSHSAKHKADVAAISAGLRDWGIQGFVAHEAMEVKVEWQKQIEAALRSCEFFVGLVHPEFISSQWTNQEVGWAYGRATPTFFIRLGADPKGFPASVQWPSVVSKSPNEVSDRIASWVNEHPPYSNLIAGRLLDALSAASSYIEAKEIALRLVKMGGLTADQWHRLDDVVVSNDQIYPNHVAWDVLAPFYDKHYRKMPSG